jgi:virulence-associated protein VapD
MMFSLKFGNEIKFVSKIEKDEFTANHRSVIADVRYENRNLVFPNTQWSSVFLGNGEEKAVFCICDEQNRVFALEVIDQRSYLDGRLVDGIYYYETIAAGLMNTKFHPNSFMGLTFTGLVKAREFVNGYEWARFQFSPERFGWLDVFLTNWFQSIFALRFNEYRSRYKDVHDRNVMFEVRSAKENGVPAFVKDWSGKLRMVKVGIRPVDVR